MYTVFVPFILRFALLAKTMVIMFIHIAIVGFSIYVNKFIYWLLQLHSKLFIVLNMPTLSYISACGLAPPTPSHPLSLIQTMTWPWRRGLVENREYVNYNFLIKCTTIVIEDIIRFNIMYIICWNKNWLDFLLTAKFTDPQFTPVVQPK